MRDPVRWDLFGDRGIAFQEIITFVAQDFTGAAFRAQVRLTPDATGSPLITPTVTLLYGGSATVSAHIAAGRLTAEIYKYVNPATGVNYVAGDTVAVSRVQLSISAANMVAPSVPAANELGLDSVLAWDLLIDPAGGALEDKWAFGSFTVRGTVTR